MVSNLEYHVRLAKNGNKRSLETVIGNINEKIYGLSLRMLGSPEDAEDESQEIIIKIITHLSEFREESAFSSWVYRVACNHILNVLKRKKYDGSVTFDFLEEVISAEADSRSHPAVLGPERAFLLEEVRFDCMQGVLACLEKDIRIAFILGELFGVTSKEGAYILDVSPEAFRKRTSRGRKRMQEFMAKHCGLVNHNGTCRCQKHAVNHLKGSPKSPGKNAVIEKESAAQNRADVVAHLEGLSEIDRTVALFRRYPEYQSPDSFATIVRDLINSGKYGVFC